MAFKGTKETIIFQTGNVEDTPCKESLESLCYFDVHFLNVAIDILCFDDLPYAIQPSNRQLSRYCQFLQLYEEVLRFVQKHILGWHLLLNKLLDFFIKY